MADETSALYALLFVEQQEVVDNYLQIKFTANDSRSNAHGDTVTFRTES